MERPLPSLVPCRGPTAQPLSITDHRISAVLRIEWNDGMWSALPHDWLRSRCRCAACAAAARRTPAASPEPFSGVTLTEIHAVADKGLNLVFSDGHGRGIYPWAYLREIGDELAACASTCTA